MNYFLKYKKYKSKYLNLKKGGFKIKLNDLEKKVFKFILDFLNNLHEFPFLKETKIRVAGGWVRDKILNVPNDDIDFVLDNVGGNIIGRLLIKKYNLTGKKTINDNLKTSKVFIPFKIIDSEIYRDSSESFEIDFATIRKEKYHTGSRNPTGLFNKIVIDNDNLILNALLISESDETIISQLNTAKLDESFIENVSLQDDINRRDFSINSLYYNLISNKIENEIGFTDIREKKINTVIPAETSFTQDPLRILRCIRFLARYYHLGFRLHPNMDKYLGEIPTNHLNLKMSSVFSSNIFKVSSEFNKMMKEGKLLLAIAYIFHFNVWKGIFGFKTDFTFSNHPIKRYLESTPKYDYNIVLILIFQEYFKDLGSKDIKEKLINFQVSKKDRKTILVIFENYSLIEKTFREPSKLKKNYLNLFLVLKTKELFSLSLKIYRLLNTSVNVDAYSSKDTFISKITNILAEERVKIVEFKRIDKEIKKLKKNKKDVTALEKQRDDLLPYDLRNRTKRNNHILSLL